jgi:hypothetical protein
MAQTATPPNKSITEQKNKPPEKITMESKKIEEGIYLFSFSSNTSNLSEDDKTSAFLKELGTFKKEHSGEKIIGYQPIFNNNPVSISGYIISTEKKALNGTILAAIITAIITATIGILTLLYTRKNNNKTLFVNNITSERVKWMGQLKEYIAEFISLVTFYNEKPVLEDRKEIGDFLDKVLHAKSKIQLHLNYKGEADIEIMQLVEKMTKNVMTAYESFNLLKQSDKVKTAYVLEKHKEQLDKRILSKIEQASATYDFLDKESILKTVQNIIRESQKEEIQIFNNKFKEDFAALKQELQSHTETLLNLTQKYLKEEWNRVKLEAEKGNISKK